MEHPIDFRELRALVVTSRSGSITGAAQDLNVGQPDLTRSLQKLERKLGVELFERHAKGVRLTEAGSLMAERARAALELLRQTAQQINAPGETLRTLMVPPTRRCYASRGRQVSAMM